VQPGDVLEGRFELAAVVETGGMGAILRAHDRLTGEPVVLKVLPELPARTEVTFRIPLELEEMAAYEVIREEALLRLEGAVPAGRARAGRASRSSPPITRLRRAACNARLVLPDARAPSAKLAVLGEMLDDLLPNQHKVLVFSQFMDHLALVREMLDERGVSYQYLDGSTPTAARKAAVDAFHAGRGEVFLISLKRGLRAEPHPRRLRRAHGPVVEPGGGGSGVGSGAPHRPVAACHHLPALGARHHRRPYPGAPPPQAGAGGRILEGSDVAGSMSEGELLDLIRGPRA
jgi:Helicase conserved C-terminal domain